MSALRKGWCPGALRPMEAKDGLLVRLRLTGGILSTETTQALAALATRHGNGLFDLSARANLQMRGVRAEVLPTLHDGLQALGLLDASAKAESIRNVIASPLAGLHGGLDIRPIMAALERRLVEDAALHALPGKFGFLIDDGSQPSLADIAADVRFDWTGEAFEIGLGGARSAAEQTGTCAPDEVADCAAQAARTFLARAQQDPQVRRMRDVLRAASGRPPRTDTPRVIVGLRTFDGAMSCLGLAAPFGRLDAAMLHSAAGLAAKTPRRELRLTPWRVILIPGLEEDVDCPGFITDPADSRLAVAACVGATGCARGTTDTQADAAILARALPPGEHLALHVSGCEKGCAKPSATPLALVARDGRYDLIRNGRAGDPPMRRALDLDAARRALACERELA